MTTPEQAAADIINLGISPTDLLLLSAATPRDKIKTKPGKGGGPPMSYITARYVMDLLDEVVGPENWQTTHTMVGDKVQCSIGLRINGEWIWKSDGAGETDIEGEKGSFSDALKRAAVSWGIARDLYPDAATHQPSPAAAGRPPSRPAAASYPPNGEQVADEAGSEPMCPVHNKLFKRNSRGWYCPTNTSGNRDNPVWCQEKP